VPRWIEFSTEEVERLDAILNDEENLTEMVTDGIAEHEATLEEYATEVEHQVAHQEVVKGIRAKLAGE